MKYPGDLELRVGRRVCRKEWEHSLPVDGEARGVMREGDTGLWVCGTLIGMINGCGIIEVFLQGTWCHPLVYLTVDHSQEDMTDEQYLYSLRQLCDVVSTKPVSGYDCTVIGNKSTECNWGFCSEDSTIWPIGKQPHQPCPLDKELRENSGCFYRCLYFQDGLRDKESVLRRYDAVIARFDN